jgi:REP element-mobilizing transposase RayT
MIKLFTILNNLNEFEYWEDDIHSVFTYMVKSDINQMIKTLLKYQAVSINSDFGFYNVNIKAENEFEKIKWLESYKLYMFKNKQLTLFFLIDPNNTLNQISENALKRLCYKIYNLEVPREVVFKNFNELIAEDKIAKVQNQLVETKEELVKTITLVLDRGEKLEDMIKKTEGLEKEAIIFRGKAKKLNRCC